MGKLDEFSELIISVLILNLFRSEVDCILGHDKQIMGAVTPALVNNAFDRNGKPAAALEDFLQTSPEILVRRLFKDYEQMNDPIKSWVNVQGFQNYF